ncbi:MAG: MerR family transcriptional regulator [Rivularia sp. T60_A2020_040]|nr:MerR family transcriptional regulator [Rivularia sp. T60_A2020_040]
MKIGKLAKQTGISVRTLHYYDEIGLLSPSGRTEADYRLYAEADIVRLQQIISLRQLGFSQARAEMEKGTDPTSESVQNIAKRWQELIAEFTGGNPGIEQSLNTMYQQEKVETASRGIGDRPLWEYMGRAIANTK